MSDVSESTLQARNATSRVEASSVHTNEYLLVGRNDKPIEELRGSCIVTILTRESWLILLAFGFSFVTGFADIMGLVRFRAFAAMLTGI